MPQRLTDNLGDVLLRAVEQSPSFVVITDLSGIVEYVNPVCCRATGYTQEEVIGRHTRMFKSGEMSAPSYAELWTTLNKGLDWRGEFHNRRKNGELYWEVATISPVRNSRGVPEHYLKVSEDITIQRALEVELEASRERYERVVTATHGFMFTVLLKDLKPVRTIYYPGSIQVTGYSDREYYADRLLWYRMIVEEDRGSVTAQIETVLNRKVTETVEHRIRHKNGSIRWVRNISVPTLDGQGRLVSYDGLINDITDLKESQALREQLVEKMREMAVHDSLTGLFSRRGFEEELSRVWMLGERRGLTTSMLIMDIDRFKVLNDTYGHTVGDQVLIEAARLISNVVRSVDVVSRYGGDEIVILLPLTGIEETRLIATRILDAFRQHIFCANTHNLRVTISIGGAFGSGGVQAAQVTLIHADQALYRAKQSGRDRACFAELDAQPLVTPTASARPSTPPLSTGSTTVRHPTSKGRILVVDDEPLMCEFATTILRKAGYSVTTAATAEEALRSAGQERGQIDASLIDVHLCESDGLEVLAQLRKVDEAMAGIVMTGFATIESAAEALKTGASDFLQKPFTRERLLEAAERAMQYRKLLLENRRYQLHLEALVAERSAALTHSLEHARQSHRETLEVLATMLETREHQTGEHCKRVSNMARILAKEMGLCDDDVATIGQGALLHDIGKIVIPDATLLKTASLSDEEWQIIKSHPRMGYDVVSVSPVLSDVSEIVYSHHERFDGTGYPRGLRGKNICMGARVFSVIDTYDAVRANRPYSPSITVEAAIGEIVKERGKQFDPDVVDAFLRCHQRLEACMNEPLKSPNAPSPQPQSTTP